MSDVSKGDGWWLASDGKWYPPAPSPDETLPPPPARADSVPPAERLRSLTAHQWTVIGAAVLVFIGALLPWASITTGFGTASRSGIDDGGDGLFTMLFGAVAALAVVRSARRGGIVAGGFGALIAGVGIWDAVDIADTELSVGSGLYLTIIGGVVMFAAGAQMWDVHRKADRTD